MGELEPSHAVVDLAFKIYEDNLLRRISWAEDRPNTTFKSIIPITPP